MDAKICDICGKAFIPDFGKGHHVLGYVVRNQIMLVRRLHEGGVLCYDICDDCIDSLDAWTKSRMIRVEVKENSDVH